MSFDLHLGHRCFLRPRWISSLSSEYVVENSSPFDPSTIYWQDVNFELPAGTTQLKLELQGKKGALLGFNNVLIYQ